jgi:hypothetical protein
MAADANVFFAQKPLSDLFGPSGRFIKALDGGEAV